MRLAVRRLRQLFVSVLILNYCLHFAHAAEPLLLIGKPTAEADFVSATADGSLTFEINGEVRQVLPTELIRWSTQASNRDRSELLLVYGSRLVLADAWTGQQAWSVEDDAIVATTKLFGKVTVPRSLVRAVLIHAPKGIVSRTKFIDELSSGKKKQGGLRLVNGDHWQGKLLKITEQPEGTRQVTFVLDATNAPLQVPEDQVAAILFGNRNLNIPTKAKWVVGLRDGSLLSAVLVTADEKRLQIQLPGGVNLSGIDVRDVVHLRSLTTESVFLSDLTPTDYKSVPYLDIPWPYHRDRNVQKGPLRVLGKTYAKGFGMHTASRLTFRLDEEKLQERFQYFVAAVAVDDLAEQGGSVVFRVYLEQDGQWQQAFVSPVIRGGDAPVSIKIELKNARQLTLITDFADRGDERDYANWLDARLE